MRVTHCCCHCSWRCRLTAQGAARFVARKAVSASSTLMTLPLELLVKGYVKGYWILKLSPRGIHFYLSSRLLTSPSFFRVGSGLIGFPLHGTLWRFHGRLPSTLAPLMPCAASLPTTATSWWGVNPAQCTATRCRTCSSRTSTSCGAVLRRLPSIATPRRQCSLCLCNVWRSPLD